MNIEKKLKRNEDDKIDYDIIYPIISNNINIYSQLRFYSNPFKLYEDKTIFIEGGIRFGGRYPDIIIDKYDKIRGENIIKYRFDSILKNGKCNINKYILKDIVNFVRRQFLTKLAVEFRDEGDYVGVSKSWGKTIDKSTKCFTESVFDCSNDDQCYKSKKEYKNSSTNITLLPYLIGDCREHAFLSGFLSQIMHNLCCSDNSCIKKSRVFYTKVYLIDDGMKKIKYIEDHVFVLFYDGEKINIIDPLYADNYSLPRIQYNENIGKYMELSNYVEYDGFNQIISDSCFYQKKQIGNSFQPSIILECGKMITSKAKEYKLINIPIIYDGSIKTINNLNDNLEYGYIMNRKLKLKDIKKWTDFDEWC